MTLGMTLTKKFRCGFVALLAVLALSGRAGAAEFSLVRNGRPDVRIVYTNAAARGGPATAQESQRFRESLDDFRAIVQRISGAEIPAVPAGDAGGDDPAGTIQIGLTPAARAAGLDQAAAKLATHGLLIRADPAKKVLYLLGTTPEGNGHALYEFLESLGCRWFMPGAFGEQLPALPTITLGAIDRTHAPAFELRAIQLRAKGAGGDPVIRGEVMEWMRRNKFGGSGPSRGHQFAKLVPTAAYWEAHPEYYSLRAGERRSSHLCMSNPGTLAAAEKFLTEHFTQNPQADGYPVALADGAQFCECPPCTKACGGQARDIMPLYLKFTGELFDRIDRKFPGREFQYGFYVYSNLMRPPRGQVPKQLAPYIAPLGYDALAAGADPERYLKLSVAADFPPETIARIRSDAQSEPARLVHDYNETFDLPVTAYLNPGAVNTFAVRTRDKYKWGGIFKRIQLYEPFVELPPPVQPAARCDCSL